MEKGSVCSFCNATPSNEFKLVNAHEIVLAPANTHAGPFICSLCIDNCCRVIGWHSPIVEDYAVALTKKQQITTGQILEMLRQKDASFSDRPISYFLKIFRELLDQWAIVEAYRELIAPL